MIVIVNGCPAGSVPADAEDDRRAFDDRLLAALELRRRERRVAPAFFAMTTTCCSGGRKRLRELHRAASVDRVLRGNLDGGGARRKRAGDRDLAPLAAGQGRRALDDGRARRAAAGSVKTNGLSGFTGDAALFTMSST